MTRPLLNRLENRRTSSQPFQLSECCPNVARSASPDLQTYLRRADAFRRRFLPPAEDLARPTRRSAGRSVRRWLGFLIGFQ
jgi:hypothetical protein